MIMFQSAGERLNKFLSYVLEYIKEKYNFSSKKVTNSELMITKLFISKFTSFTKKFIIFFLN